MLGVDAQVMVGHVAVNRMAHPSFPNNQMEVIKQGFYGRAQPTQECLWSARLTMVTESTHDYLYVLSEEDRQYLDFGPGDEVIAGPLPLHFYKEWR